MNPFPQHIVPIPQPDVEEIFTTYQLTYEFYDEVRYRQELVDYCQWYQEVAEQHRQELGRMQREINFLGWFTKSWRRR